MVREFDGLNPRVAKRRALNFWYVHRGELGLSVAEFFALCRVRSEGGVTRIVFHGDRAKGAA